MKRTTELDESDILTVLAQRFNVDETDVTLVIELKEGKNSIKAIVVDEDKLLR